MSASRPAIAMPRFAANLTTMFQEFAVQEQFRLAAECGFTGIELLSPYEHPPETITAWLEDNRLQLVLINIAPGPTMGSAAIVGMEQSFEAAFDQAVTYATALGAPMIHVLAGRATDQLVLSRPLFIENIRAAAERAAKRDVTIMLEPINDRDAPNYFHSRSDETASLIHDIGCENVRLQFDCYHMQIMEGDLCYHLEKHRDIIGHIQFSSLPGRNEPQHGEVNLPHVFEFIDRMGYDGWIGCEYKPHTDTMSGLSWAKRWGIHPPESR